MNRGRHAFTLLEIAFLVLLLVVVVLVAIPNHLRASVRSKVSRAQADQRSMGTALNSYYVDSNAYPLAMVEDFSTTIVGNVLLPGATRVEAAPCASPDGNGGLSGNALRIARSRATFAHPSVAGNQPGGFSTLTTPIQYITSYFLDPFSHDRKLTFSYLPDGPGWLLASFRHSERKSPEPTTLSPLAAAMRLQFIRHVDTPFKGRAVAVSKALLRVDTHRDGRSLTYDPTNGIASEGSIYRISD